jgi:hypothetical protein
MKKRKAKLNLPSNFLRLMKHSMNCRGCRDTLAGQFLEKIPGPAGIFLPGRSPAYLFSRPFKLLELDPTYPKNQNLYNYLNLLDDLSYSAGKPILVFCTACFALAVRV